MVGFDRTVKTESVVTHQLVRLGIGSRRVYHFGFIAGDPDEFRCLFGQLHIQDCFSRAEHGGIEILHLGDSAQVFVNQRLHARAARNRALRSERGKNEQQQGCTHHRHKYVGFPRHLETILAKTAILRKRLNVRARS